MSTPPKPIEQLIREAMIAKAGGPSPQLNNFEETAIRVTGYRGRCDVPGWMRLYLNERFDEYIEVDEGSVLAEVSLGTADSPLILLVLDPDAEIKHVAAMSEVIEAQFLTGSIMQRNLGGNRVVVNPYPWPNDMPIGQSAHCGSWGRACGSWGRACGSWVFC